MKDLKRTAKKKKKKKKMKMLVKVSTLYLSMKVQDRNFTTKLFDERDGFPFYINTCSIRNVIYNVKSLSQLQNSKYY